MCGIVGILGKEAVADDLVDALRRLEYRGYDSAGIATVDGGKLDRRRARGKLKNLQKVLNTQPLGGLTGIGHTRWATHGAPTEKNAHPHSTSEVSVVHNGIIENFQQLRASLEGRGVEFSSETDTEVIAHLITEELRTLGNPVKAVEAALKQFEGAFALAIIFSGYDNMMIGAKKGSPLAIGHGEGVAYLGSDAIALAPFTNEITYLEDGDWVVLTRENMIIRDENSAVVKRERQIVDVSTMVIDKGEYRHFMAKEIHEQPEVISDTLAGYVDFSTSTVKFEEKPFSFKDLPKITIVACGTAYYAGLVAKYWFERYARIPVEIDVASEFRYREAPMEKGGLMMVVSQSGETADTLAALKYCKTQGQYIGAVVNVRTSNMAKEADVVWPTMAGTEIGVASTKAFTCQLTVLACLAIQAGRERGTISEDLEKELVHALLEIPREISTFLKDESLFEALAHPLSKAKDVMYLGRGLSFPLAMEGALKLKEISYIHAEGYAAGELKHGPIALIAENVPVIVVAPKDYLFEKTLSNVQEVVSRGAKVVMITDAKNVDVGNEPLAVIQMPTLHDFVTPLLYAVPIQLISYYTAVQMGTDVDQPRNLAKSVTVE